MKKLIICLFLAFCAAYAQAATSILGQPVASAARMYAYVQSKNPGWSFTEEIAREFHDQGERYGIRGDIALCQACVETGWFKYSGSAVTPDQHNYCGLGVTYNGAKGNSFGTVADGVSAQLQHLWAYATTASLPSGWTLVDPRFNYVNRGCAPTWESLGGGHWAASSNYGSTILSVYNAMMAFAFTEPEPPEPPAPPEPEIPQVENHRSAYAYDVRIEHGNPSAPAVLYRLNAPAASVSVDLLVDGRVVATRTANGDITDGSVQFANIWGNGRVTARVTAVTKHAVSGPTRVGFAADGNPNAVDKGILAFSDPRSITFDNCPDSPLFGTCLIAEAGTDDGAGSYYSTGSASGGLSHFYAFDGSMQGLVNPVTSSALGSDRYGFTAKLGTYGNQTYNRKLARMRFSDDGRLFLAMSALSDGGLYELDATSVAALDNRARKIFTGSLYSDWGETWTDGLGSSTFVGAASTSVATWGAGDGLRVAVTTTNRDTHGVTNNCTVMLYDLGRATSWNRAPTAMIDGRDGHDNEVNRMRTPLDMHLEFDADGRGLLVTAWGTDAADYVSAIHATDGMTVNYRDHDTSDKRFMHCTAVAYNKDRTLMALARSDGSDGAYVNVFSLGWGAPGTMPTLTWRETIDFSNHRVLGCSLRDMAFDYANNLWCADYDSHGVICVQLPSSTSGASQTTPSPASQAYTLGNGAARPSSSSLVALPAYAYLVKGGAVTGRRSLEQVDSVTVTGGSLAFHSHLQKTPNLTAAITAVDSLTFAAPVPGADVMDLRWDADGRMADVSPMGMPVKVMSATGRAGVEDVAALGQRVAVFANPWQAAVNRNTAYAYVDYRANTAFKNALAGSHTLECMVRATYTGDFAGNYHKIFCSLQEGGTGFETANDGQLMFTVNASDDGSASWQNVRSSVVPVSGRWYHLVGVWDRTAGQARLYIDGRLAAEKSIPARFHAVQSPEAQWFGIAANPGPDGMPVDTGNWAVASARIYGRALTPTEVQNLYQKAKPAD